MEYKIFFTKEAKKDINGLDFVIKKRLAKKLKYIANCDDIKTLAKRLVNFEAGECRLRIGDYRIVFDLDKKTLYILRVRHRKGVYKYKK